ncbi:MAG: VOC family protein [Nocardioidaceae bacterium]
MPYLRYADPAAAIRWLSQVFGAREGLRMTLPDGRIGHAELSLGTGLITLGLTTEPASDTQLPSRSTLTAMTLVFVDDVDAAAQRAVTGGGKHIDPAVNQPWGLRQAIVADPEHQLWELSTYLREVAPGDWGAEIIAP